MSYYRPTGFSMLPNVVKNLIIINGLVYLFLFANVGVRFWMMKHLALWMPGGDYFIPTQYVTYQFVHSFSDPFHLIFNMFALWMFGTMVENVWGSKRFLSYYLICGIGAGVVQNVAQLIYLNNYIGLIDWSILANQIPPTVGASGAIYGVLVAYGYLFPDSQIYIYFLVPIKAKYFVMILMAISLLSGISNNPGDNVAHFAHLGGAVVGLIMIFGKKFFKRNSF